MTHPPRSCTVCGTTFTPPFHPGNQRQIRKTCSQACWQELQRRNHLGPKNNWWKHGRYSKHASGQ